MTRPQTARSAYAARNSAHDRTGEHPLVDQFEAMARTRPHAIAVTRIADGAEGVDEQLSYGTLNRLADRLAARLRAHDAGPERIVGIAVDHDWATIVAILAVMKCGAGFLPLDGAMPETRLARMLADSRVGVVIAPEGHRARKAAGPRVACLVVEREARGAPAAPSSSRVRRDAGGAQAAYVIYTSGSTGEPKGVLVPQSALANHARGFGDIAALSPYDHVLQFANLGFDAAYEEILPTLVRGANLVLRSGEMEKDIGAFLQRCGERHITVLDLPTAFWHLLTATLRADGPIFPETVRCVVLGGEEAAPGHVKFWDEHYGLTVRLLNTYGPTEATIIATAGDLLGRGETADAGVPLGGSLPNTRIAVSGRTDARAPGDIGEILIAGAGVARGYVNTPRLTAERFVPESGGPPGSRAYRTGDLGLLTSAGEVLFKGRQDRQVKVNGHRIQLEEVEQALLGHPSIASCAVLVKDNRLGGKHLVAYCVLDRDQGPLPFEASPLSVMLLKTFLREKLPEFMIPGEFSFLEKFILNASGKIDRTKLPEVGYLDRKYRGLKPYAPPAPGLQTALAEIWCQVLDLDMREISIDDPFEYLGGNSLYSIEVRYIAQEAGLLFNAGDLHLRQTLRGLASCCRNEGRLIDRARHALVDYTSYARSVARLVRREIAARTTRRHGAPAAAQRAFEKFHGTLRRRENIFYLFFTKNLLHWMATSAGFVPPSVNLVLIGSGLTDDEVTWVTRRMDRPFLHLKEEIDVPAMWDILFAVNTHNFGWLDVDCFIMNPGIFDEMIQIGPDQAINCLWSHAACGPTKRPFSVLESYFLFFNIEVIKALRAASVLPRPYSRYANARQVAMLQKLIPGEPSRRAQLTGTLRGRAFTHRLFDFQFGPLILYQLVANTSGYKLNRVRFFTEIDSFNLYNYYSDEAIHVFPTIRHYDKLPWSGIDQKRRLASDYLLMTGMLDELPPAYQDRARMLERHIVELEMDPARMAYEIREYLRARGVSERTFGRPEFAWMADRVWPRAPQVPPSPPLHAGQGGIATVTS
jgi:amino acid adenylation domain-containing protein